MLENLVFTVTPSEAAYMLLRYEHEYPEETAWLKETLKELNNENQR